MRSLSPHEKAVVEVRLFVVQMALVAYAASITLGIHALSSSPLKKDSHAHQH